MAYVEVGEKAERQAEVARRRRRCFETREGSWTSLISLFVIIIRYLTTCYTCEELAIKKSHNLYFVFRNINFKMDLRISSKFQGGSYTRQDQDKFVLYCEC